MPTAGPCYLSTLSLHKLTPANPNLSLYPSLNPLPRAPLVCSLCSRVRQTRAERVNTGDGQKPCAARWWRTKPQKVPGAGSVAPGFPDGSVGKESPGSAGDPALTPGSGRSPGEGNGNPLQYSCLENPMDRGAWRATVCGVAGVRQGWATEPLA